MHRGAQGEWLGLGWRIRERGTYTSLVLKLSKQVLIFYEGSKHSIYFHSIHKENGIKILVNRREASSSDT